MDVLLIEQRMLLEEAFRLQGPQILFGTNFFGSSLMQWSDRIETVVELQLFMVTRRSHFLQYTNS